MAAQALQGASLQGQTVWYVAFAADHEAHDSVRRQLDTHALRLAQVELSPMTLTSYRIPVDAAFAGLRLEPVSEVHFAGGLSLVGLGLSETYLAPSQKLDVALRWRARALIEGDYSLFAHLLDQDQNRLTQHDELLVGSSHQPSSLWVPGDESDVRFLMTIPANAPAGDFDLVVGVYEVESADRLWLENVEGLQNDTVYPLAAIHVEPLADEGS